MFSAPANTVDLPSFPNTLSVYFYSPGFNVTTMAHVYVFTASGSIRQRHFNEQVPEIISVFNKKGQRCVTLCAVSKRL